MVLKTSVCILGELNSFILSLVFQAISSEIMPNFENNALLELQLLNPI